jgi:hypothetical protein
MKWQNWQTLWIQYIPPERTIPAVSAGFQHKEKALLLGHYSL